MSKKLKPKKSQNYKQMYAQYKKSVDNPVSYRMFTVVLDKYNKEIIVELLAGKTLNMGHYLGTLSIIQKERDFRKPAIDWKATNAHKEETGEWKYIYYTDNSYFMFLWDKRRAKVKNKTVYKFVAANGPIGAKTLLKNYLKADPFAGENFKHIKVKQ